MPVKHVCPQCGNVLSLNTPMPSLKCPKCKVPMPPETMGDAPPVEPAPAEAQRPLRVARSVNVMTTPPPAQQQQPQMRTAQPAAQQQPQENQSSQVEILDRLTAVAEKERELLLEKTRLEIEQQRAEALKQTDLEAQEIIAKANADAAAAVELKKQEAEKHIKQLEAEARQLLKDKLIAEENTLRDQSKERILEEVKKIAAEAKNKAKEIVDQAQEQADKTKEELEKQKEAARQIALDHAKSIQENAEKEAKELVEKTKSELAEQKDKAQKAMDSLKQRTEELDQRQKKVEELEQKIQELAKSDGNAEKLAALSAVEMENQKEQVQKDVDELLEKAQKDADKIKKDAEKAAQQRMATIEKRALEARKAVIEDDVKKNQSRLWRLNLEVALLIIIAVAAWNATTTLVKVLDWCAFAIMLGLIGYAIFEMRTYLASLKAPVSTPTDLSENPTTNLTPNSRSIKPAASPKNPTTSIPLMPASKKQSQSAPLLKKKQVADKPEDEPTKDEQKQEPTKKEPPKDPESKES